MSASRPTGLSQVTSLDPWDDAYEQLGLSGEVELAGIGYLAWPFDLFSVRNLSLITQAHEVCDRLVVGVFSDTDLAAAMGIDPVTPARDRRAILRRVRGVDKVVRHATTELDAGDDLVVLAPAGSNLNGVPVGRYLEPLPARSPASTAPPSTPRLPGQVVGYVPGAWDMFHVGHLNILLRAREFCDYLVAGAVTDEALLAAKGHLPVVKLADRARILRHLDFVDDVVIDYSSDKTEVWRAHPFDVLFKGDDWLGTPKGDRLVQQMATVNATVHFFPYTKETSSTLLRSLMNAR